MYHIGNEYRRNSAPLAHTLLSNTSRQTHTPKPIPL